METNEENKENAEYFVEELPKAKLSPTSNPLVFLEKDTGTLYYLEGSVPYREAHLVKLNDGIETPKKSLKA